MDVETRDMRQTRALISHINLIYDKIYTINKEQVVQTRSLCLPSTVT